MKSEWKGKKLGDVLTLKRGYDLPKQNRVEGEYPILSSSGINGYNDVFKVHGPGVVTGRSGQLGKVFFSESDFWPLNTTLYVQDFKGNDPKFIYYFLQTLNLSNFNTGSSVPTLNRNHVHLLEVQVPDFEVQKEIASILGGLDSKIELNNQMIATLEELAATLFKQWFVDFEFPDENGNPYKSSGGKMVDSELGEIPEGWEVKEAGNIFKIVYGKNFPKKELINDGFRVYGANGVIGFSEKYLYKNPQVIVTSRGSGSGDLFITREKSFITNNALIFEDESNQFGTNLIFHILRKGNPYNYRTGSAQPQITINNISKMKIVLPDCTTVVKWKKIFNVHEKLLFSLSDQSEDLKKTRDELLPNLLSGKINLIDEGE